MANVMRSIRQNMREIRLAFATRATKDGRRCELDDVPEDLRKQHFQIANAMVDNLERMRADKPFDGAMTPAGPDRALIGRLKTEDGCVFRLETTF